MRGLRAWPPRCSIRAKLTIAFCLFAAVPVLVAGGYGAWYTFHLLEEGVRERLAADVSMKARAIDRLLDSARRDVRFLASSPAPPALGHAFGEAADGARTRVALEWLEFARARPAYDQIRYLDEHGREVLRIDGGAAGGRLVPAEALQDKSDRYYFREATAAPPGAVYVSPMDLNVERGAVELPYKPVVRYATRAVGPRGEPRGVVVANVLASHIIEEALRTGGAEGETALVSSGGYYLSRAIPGPGSDARLASPFPAWLAFAGERVGTDTLAIAPGERVASAFPGAVAERILSAHAGIGAEPGLRGRLVAFAPVFPSREPGAEYWVVVHAVPKATILASVRGFQVSALAVAAAALGVAVVVGFAAARRFTRPIAELEQAAHAFAHGRFDRPVRVDTRDELEDLARQLGRMATDLDAQARELRAARERAERRAQEAQALHRIAAEMLVLLDLPSILQLVVNKAREILGADLALLVVGAPGGLRPVAVSGGEPEVGRPPREAPMAEVACEPHGCRGTSCPLLDRYRYAAHTSTPLLSEGRGLGYLCVGYRQTREVSPEEREVLQSLGSQAAIAIEKARLQERVRALAALEERERIAADLHDGIIQAIYATGLGVEECLRLLDESPLEARARLEATVDRLNTVIRDVRNYVVGLPPEALQRRGLRAGLEELARDLAVNGLADAVVEIDAEVEAALSAEERRQLFQAGGEALANVVKHAHGARAVLRLATVDGMMRLSVTDDGPGFEPEERMGAGRGLLNLAERARRLGGTLTVESAPGQGTRIAVDVRLEGRR